MADIEVGSGWRRHLEVLSGKRKYLPLAGLGVTVIPLLLLQAARPPARIAPASTHVSSAPSSFPDGQDLPSEVVFVHVAGAVAAPGLYSLPVGARVADALEAAGGPTRRAHLGALNLAQIVTDGIKVEVPLQGEPAVPTPVATAGPTARISLNSADQAALETVPGIGPVRAAAIIAFRTQRGGFSSIEELLDVQGIGPTIFASIRDLVTL